MPSPDRSPRDPAPSDRPDPVPASLPPVDVDGVTAIAVGTGIWALVLVVLLALRPRLEEAGTGWWIGVALAGFVLGLIGLPYLLGRRSALRRAGDRTA